MEAKDDELLTNFGATRCSIWGLELFRTGRHSWAQLGTAGHSWAPLGTARHICANFATCSWEPLTMLNPYFAAGEHGLFGGYECTKKDTASVQNIYKYVGGRYFNIISLILQCWPAVQIY